VKDTGVTLTYTACRRVRKRSTGCITQPSIPVLFGWKMIVGW